MNKLTAHILLICLTLSFSVSTWSVSASVTENTDNVSQMMSHDMKMDCEHQQTGNDCPHCQDQHQCAQGHNHCVSPIAIPVQQTRISLSHSRYQLTTLPDEAGFSQLSSTPFRPPIAA